MKQANGRPVGFGRKVGPFGRITQVEPGGLDGALSIGRHAKQGRDREVNDPLRNRKN
jgi:hypothetical protein